MVFYMYDYDDYKNNLRDFYISLDELPGPICKTQDEVEDVITKLSGITCGFRQTSCPDQIATALKQYIEAH